MTSNPAVIEALEALNHVEHLNKKLNPNWKSDYELFFKPIRAALSEQHVDVEALKKDSKKFKDVDGKGFCRGWNNCLKYLAEQGHLTPRIPEEVCLKADALLEFLKAGNHSNDMYRKALGNLSEQNLLIAKCVFEWIESSNPYYELKKSLDKALPQPPEDRG